jgi:hypothetical protein
MHCGRIARPEACDGLVAGMFFSTHVGLTASRDLPSLA